jgi:hypothetical protein
MSVPKGVPSNPPLDSCLLSPFLDSPIEGFVRDGKDELLPPHIGRVLPFLEEFPRIRRNRATPPNILLLIPYGDEPI